MSQENVDALVRGAGAFNRKDIDALLEEVDAEVEWSAALPVTLGRRATAARGRDLGDRLFARPSKPPGCRSR